MKKQWVWLIFLAVAGWWLYPATVSGQQQTEEPRVRAVLFYSPTCYHCHYVIDEVLMPMLEEYGDRLQIMAVDTTQPSGEQLYQAAVQTFQIPNDRRGVPTLIMGQVVLVGSGEIPEQFPGMVKQTLAAGGIDWPDLPGLVLPSAEQAEPTPLPPTATPVPVAVAPVAANSEAAPVYLAYFFDPTCLECARVSAQLETLQARYDNLVVRTYDVREESALNEAMCEKYGLPDEYRLVAPVIFVGNNSLTPEEITEARLKTIIENPQTAQIPAPWEGLVVDETEAESRIVERFNQFSVLAVASAGLLDGVNPCAFTTIIFFVSYLALVGRKGRDILLVGAAFTAAVFLTYLAMGLGLAEVVRQIGAFSIIGQIIYGITALVCLALAALSLWDYVKIRQGRLNDIALQLPAALKKRIHHTIRTRSRMSGFVWAAFGAGVLVSVFELACTGQVYLPTIIFVTGVAQMRLTAIAYLVLYNFMFIVPLVAVFAVTYWGTSSQQLTNLFRDKAGLIKLFTAVLFGVLAVWLGYMVWVA